MALCVGIIGAGIGGLTAALACRQAGFDVELLSTSCSEQADGAVDLPPNATRLLRALKVLDEVESVAVRPEAIHFRAARSGYLIASRPLGKFAADRYGAPHLHVLHSALLDVLRAQLPHRRIEACTVLAVGSISQNDDFVTVECDDTTLRLDVLIVCDGADSTTRRQLFGGEPARFLGRIEWQALIPADAAAHGRPRHAITRWLGPNGHFIQRDVDGGHRICLTGIASGPPHATQQWMTHDRGDDFVHAFDGWHPSVMEMISRAATCRSRALHDHAAATTWSRGRIVLLGNACHPLLPYVDQGGAMAIEDAWILSRLLGDWEDDDVTAALLEYARYRQPRVTRVQNAARENSTTYHEADAMRAFGRNLKLALGTRLLPELAIEQFDWLYGYDAVKGFD